MTILADLVQHSTATTGTGTITLGSAVTGFRTVTAAGIADGSVVSYAIQEGTNRETGTGVIGGSGTTLTRVLRASSTGSLLNLTGSAQVGIVANAGDFVPQVNMTATSAPTASNDQTQGYSVGSQWLWAARGLLYMCTSAATGAAYWQPVSDKIGGSAVGATRHQSWSTRMVGNLNPWQGTSGSGGSYTNPNAVGSGALLRVGTTSGTGLARFINTSTAPQAGSGVNLTVDATINWISGAYADPSSAESWQVQAGYYQSGSVDTPGNNFAVFQLRWNGSAAEFLCRSRNNGGTIQATAISLPTLGAIENFRVQIIGTSSVLFWRDNTLVATHTTVPIGSLFETVDVFRLVGTANRGINLMGFASSVYEV